MQRTTLIRLGSYTLFNLKGYLKLDVLIQLINQASIQGNLTIELIRARGTHQQKEAVYKIINHSPMKPHCLYVTPQSNSS